MNKVAIMQPYLFPYIGYFQLIDAVNTFVIYDDVQYMKRGWINRNNILINNEKRLFTVELNGASTEKNIKDITIKDDFVKFKKTLNANYAKAPYFADTIALMDKIFSFPDKNLAKFVGNSIVEIARYLELPTDFMYSSDISKDKELKAQDKIIAICKELDAEVYINSFGGQELYNKDDFKNENIILNFIKPEIVQYKQFNNEFIPGLSIVDVLMFNSKSQTRQILKYGII